MMASASKTQRPLLAIAASAVLLICSTGTALEYVADTTEDGATFILVHGQFDQGADIEAFRALALQRKASFVVFDSPGGNVRAALDLGRTIRALNLDTVQPRFLDCISACAFAFMGGKMRFAEAGAIGMHRSSLGQSPFDVRPEVAVSAIQLHTAEIITFMTEMNIDPALLQLALQYDSTDVRYLSTSEMEQYRVVSTSNSAPEHPRDPTLQPNAIPPAPQLSLTDENQIRSGKVHHPSGGVHLKGAPSTSASDIVYLANGTQVSVLTVVDNWHQVSSESIIGWLERSWMSVDGFAGGQTENRFVQIASFDTPKAANAFARSSELDVWVYETSTGWYAVTLAGEFEREHALNLSAQLKGQGSIPSDSFVHYGNTFIRRICCD